MCVKDFCPCSDTIKPSKFGSNADIFLEQMTTTGSAIEFYSDCYLKLLKDKSLSPLDDSTLAIIEKLEYENNCAGLCETPFFFFFKDNNKEPPVSSCKEPTVNYYKAET
jgi:hypothetical protein